MKKKKKEKVRKKLVVDERYSNPDTNAEFNKDIDLETEVYEVINADNIYNHEIIEDDGVSDNIPPLGERP